MRIDVTKIPGYADMTPEQKLEALESYEIEAPRVENNRSDEIQRLRDAVSKANSEAADYKKQLRAKLSDEEAAAAQAAEAAQEREAMQRELESLRKEKAIGAYQTKFLGLGYDAASAEKAAKALQAGDFDSVFAVQEKFIEATKKSAVAESLKQQPSLSGGDPLSPGVTEDSVVSAFRNAAMR